eukprot:s3548_g13.t1
MALRMALRTTQHLRPLHQGSAMELELSQALIELRRLTLFQGPALGEAIPRYFTEEQLRELMARLEDAQLYMRDLREENPVSRRKKAEHQAKQITAAMEEAKKAAAKRREEALERLAKEEAEELRRYEADLAKATKASLGTADAEPDAMDPGARASTDPAPATPAPLDA